MELSEEAYRLPYGYGGGIFFIEWLPDDGRVS